MAPHRAADAAAADDETLIRIFDRFAAANPRLTRLWAKFVEWEATFPGASDFPWWGQPDDDDGDDENEPAERDTLEDLFLVWPFSCLCMLHVAVFSPLAWDKFARHPGYPAADGAPGAAWAGCERATFAVLASLVLELAWWLANCVNYLVMAEPQLYARWAIGGAARRAPDDALLRKAAKDAAVGHALRPLLLWLAHPLYEWRAGAAFPFGDFPPLGVLACHVAFAVALDDTLFYWLHRLLHHPRIYRHVHKQHHEFHHPVGLATEYAHPIEDLLCNTLSTVAGPLLLGSHASVVIGYASLKLWQSVDAHSGLLLPFSPWSVALLGMDCARAHDFHHSHNSGNYGGFFMFWDWACGTDAAYKRHLRAKRD